MTRISLALMALVGALACSPVRPDAGDAAQPQPTAVDAGRHGRMDCVPLDVGREPLSMAAFRDAHRWAETRRELRFMDAVQPGFSLRRIAALVPQAGLESGDVCVRDAYVAGRLLFEHEFTTRDGLGSGSRPAGRLSPFYRVHTGTFGGPETTTCAACHWRGGPGGAGAMADNSYILGAGDRVEEGDARNPPALQGAGVVQALGAEMTQELAQQRAQALAAAKQSGTPSTVSLNAKGVAFGSLTARPDGTLDTSAVEGIDADLVVKPFGWKGNVATLKDFIPESLQFHLGIQSEGLLARHRRTPNPEMVGSGQNPLDPDRDGVTMEMSDGQETALALYLATLGMPLYQPHETVPELDSAAPGLTAPLASVYVEEWAHGRELFASLGCIACHRPMMVLKSPVVKLESAVTGGMVEVDLSRDMEHPRLEYDATVDGYPVFSFSDFKRHDMGEENASRHEDRGVAPRMYMTRRLWGLTNSPPYFHDGRAPWIIHAVEAHGGEAAMARDAYKALDYGELGAINVFLVSLRRAPVAVVP